MRWRTSTGRPATEVSPSSRPTAGSIKWSTRGGRRARDRGVGVRTDGGVVLVADERVRSPLIERDSVEKLHAIDDYLGVASAGHVADGRRLVDHVRRDAQVNRLRYGERLAVETATEHVTEFVQRYA